MAALSSSSSSNPLSNAPTPARRAAFSWRSIGSSLITWVLALLVFGPFLIYPVFKVLVGAVSIPNYQTGTRTLELSRLLTPISDRIVRESIINSFILAIAATLLASLIAIPLAYAAARLKFAGKSLLTGLLLVPLLLPPLVGAVGLRQMLAREGFINTLLHRNATNPIDFLSSSALGGHGQLLMVIIVAAFHLYPLIYLNVSAAWSNIDSSLEEAAENMGASVSKVFRSVTVPLLLPGYLSGALIVFIFAFTDLGTPLIFGYNKVAAVQIFNSKSSNDPSAGYVISFYLVILAGLIFWISRRYLDGGKIATLARGTRRARETEPSLGGKILLYLYFFMIIAAALLPHIGVIMASFAHDWTSQLFPTWTTENYKRVFTDPSIPAANSIKISLICALSSMVLDVIGGFALAYALVRGRVWARGLLDTIAMLPLALPGLILAFGLLITFHSVGGKANPLDPATNPIPLLIIAYSIRRLPYALRSVSAGLQQMSVALEEASLNMGASPLQTMWQITRPLVTANLIAAGLLTFAFAVLEVSDSLVLTSFSDQIPIAQAIYKMVSSNNVYPGCALGVIGMLLLTGTFLLVNRLLGKQLGALFRA